MARPAGQDQEIMVRVSGGVIKGQNTIKQRRALAENANTPRMRHTLAWIADQAGASALASSITGLSSTEEFDSTHTYQVTLKAIRDSEFLIVIKHEDASGFDVSNTLEYEAARSGLQAALAQVAGDFGATTLQSQITAI